MRVQIPVWTDRWMMGDRYGEVVKVITRNKLDPQESVMLHIKLDKSGKVVKFLEADCIYV